MQAPAGRFLICLSEFTLCMLGNFAKDTLYGLAAPVFTQDMHKALKFTQNVHAGTFLIALIELYLILKHLIYIANAKKPVISNNNGTVLKAKRKHALADINCH